MERLLHYVWKHKLFASEAIATVTGESLKIIDVGIHNADAGPDFFNAKIQIDDTFWAGNVEIHTYSSDWYKHGHDKNTAYDSVILHVVKYCDAEIFRTNGELLPQLILSYPSHIDENYEYLLNADISVPCSLRITEIPALTITSWLSALSAERLEQKTERILHLMEQYNNSWEEVLYVALGRYFGLGVNGDAFERLTRSLPFIYLLKHSDSLFQLEALLFGQAGMLSKEIKDEYFLQLQKEYAFMQHKYNLQPVNSDCWKSHRLRPPNFPEIRIAQFAALYHQKPKLFSRIMEIKEIAGLRDLFKIKPSSYWKNHYNFDNLSNEQEKSIGNTLIDSLLINAVVPVVFAYGVKHGNTDFTERALSFLENLPPENNKIIREWETIGLKALNSTDTQAIIQLKREYCEQKKCLFCRIGQEMLRKK